ncbi:hypothetical protein QZH41_001659, partial [Actinostola sp. cb2023]
MESFNCTISADGIKPDDKKVDAVKNARPPQNAAEVRSFLGLVNYCARFIPNFATLAEPLRRLTRGDTDWSWGEAQRNAFDRLRAVLTSDCVVAHFNQSADTQLKVDASPVGLGAILLQENNGTVRPVAYASRTLTDVERRYSQTEKEALAVVWACERFHLYLYGKEFMLYTDHKPLEVIYSPKSKPPPRIERWALRLQPYRFTIAHMAGKTNPADVLSRLPLDDQPFRERNIAEEYINYVTVNAVPKALTLEQIKEATSTDHVLQQVKNCLHGAVWPDTPELLPYKQVKDELCASNGVVLRGSKIVIPTALHHATLCNAHEGHQGIVRTKQMIREKVWWPGILRQVEAMVKACLPCQSVAVTKSAVEPLRPSVMPAKPWQEVHIDLCGPFPTGETLLVCEDACSRWPEVVILRSTTSAAIIGHLKKIFAAYGLPEKVITDNGANLVSQEFEDFLKTHGVQHRKVTPYWPQANAEVERFNRTIGKAIRTVHVEGKDWRTEMFTFLLNYRATPHASTGVSPALLHLGREIRTKVPQVEGRVSNLLSDALQCAHMKDQQAKQRMKSYVDKKNNAVPSDIQTGDKVLLQQARHNKLTTRYDPKPYMVLERRGPSVILQRENGRMFMRNVSLFSDLYLVGMIEPFDGEDFADYSERLNSYFIANNIGQVAADANEATKLVADKKKVAVTISVIGVSPTKEKVQAIQDAAPPTNVAELQSFIGAAANFLHTVLRHYDPAIELVLQCDASSMGVGAALLQPGPDGKMFLVLVDAYSKFVDIIPMTQATSANTIAALRHTFSYFGLPEHVVTDNGSQFTSAEFQKFLTDNCIQHTTTAPGYPATNGLAERYVGDFKDKLTKIGDTGEPLQTKLDRFLLTYRATPTSLGKTPSELLMNRQPRIRLSALRAKQSKQEVKIFQDNLDNKPKFHQNQPVFVRNFGKGARWVPGVIIGTISPRNYEVQ